MLLSPFMEAFCLDGCYFFLVTHIFHPPKLLFKGRLWVKKSLVMPRPIYSRWNTRIFHGTLLLYLNNGAKNSFFFFWNHKLTLYKHKPNAKALDWNYLICIYIKSHYISLDKTLFTIFTKVPHRATTTMTDFHKSQPTSKAKSSCEP